MAVNNINITLSNYSTIFFLINTKNDLYDLQTIGCVSKAAYKFALAVISFLVLKQNEVNDQILRYAVYDNFFVFFFLVFVFLLRVSQYPK